MSTGYWAEGKGTGSRSDLWMSLAGWQVAGFLITVVANLREVTDGGEVCLVSVFQGYSHGGVWEELAPRSHHGPQETESSG